MSKPKDTKGDRARSSRRPTPNPGLTNKEVMGLVKERDTTTQDAPSSKPRTPHEILQDRWYRYDTVPLVEILWVDAISTGDDWLTDTDLDTHPGPSLALGYLTNETALTLTVTALINEVHYANGITIPKACVLSIRPLTTT